MKSLFLLFGTLSLLLTGYRPAPPPAAASPAPDLSDPNAYVMARLEDCLDGDKWQVRFWIFPGSGPVSVTLPDTEYGQPLRTLFSALDWEVIDRPADDETPSPPGTYSVQIIPGYPDPDHTSPITVHSGEGVLRLDTYSEEEGYASLHLRAQGVEDLCDAISALWPGPDAALGLVRIQPEKTQWSSAKAYMEAVFSKLSENGHITASRIDSLDVLPLEADPDQPGPPALAFQVRFSLTPSRPDLSCWSDRLDEAGWAHYALAVHTTWDETDGAYGLNWYESLGV